ncbi:hypothetical protein [Desulfosediminicola sp.]|uniref:hypothetical protein n=1 Tax=Desulfosediminicola sp. TaxID=2886825 RepID=UPI003AF2D5A3
MVRATDASEAVAILEKEYLQTTGLKESDLQVADAVFDENAASTVCPACNTSFVPSQNSECPECGLRFG